VTTFQAVVTAIVHGFTEILPLSAPAHQAILTRILGWDTPPSHVLGVLSLGTALAIFIYYRHDWASMISSLIRVFAFRKLPMTIDERLPFFLLLASAPSALAWYFFGQHHEPTELETHPLVIAAGLTVFAMILKFTDSYSRRNRKMFDWNWMDATFVGLMQAITFIPVIGLGLGRSSGGLIAGFMRNYHREAALKFALYAQLPALTAHSIIHLEGFSFHAAQPAPSVSWLSLTIAFVVGFAASLLAIGGIVKHLERNNTSGYVNYRCFLAVAVGIAGWFFIS